MAPHEGKKPENILFVDEEFRPLGVLNDRDMLQAQLKVPGQRRGVIA